jgi:flagellar biosynthesis anti-sigma factor FlgM
MRTMDKIAAISSAPRIASAADIANKAAVAKPAAQDARSQEPSSAPEHPASVATLVDAIVAQGPPINLEKIARVRAEMARGTFEVNRLGIADAMLNLPASEQ